MVWEGGVGSREETDKHDPRQPSQQEKEDHETTHLPFRSSCRHCVMETGREEDCRKTKEEERQVPEVHFSWLQEKEKDKGCVQYSGFEEDDGRMDLPNGEEFVFFFGGLRALHTFSTSAQYTHS